MDRHLNRVRVCPSGASKRKAKKDNETKTEQEVAKLKKMNDIFKKIERVGSSGTVGSNTQTSDGDGEDSEDRDVSIMNVDIDGREERDGSDMTSDGGGQRYGREIRDGSSRNRSGSGEGDGNEDRVGSIRVESANSNVESTENLDDTLVGEQNNNYVAVAVPSSVSSDIGHWHAILPESFREFWIKSGSSSIRHCSEELFLDHSYRQFRNDRDAPRICTKGLFSRQNHNGEVVDRKWFCFSLRKGHVFCFTFRLMCSDAESSTYSELTSSGLSDWKNAQMQASHY